MGERGEPLDTKYLYVTHSELNAILNYRGGSLEGAKMYVTLFPCNECAKAIIQAGIKTLSMTATNMQAPHPFWPPKECWMPQAYAITSTQGPERKITIECIEKVRYLPY